MQRQLDELQKKDLYRELLTFTPNSSNIVEFEGEKLINFSSNDYLGLSQHPEIIATAQQALGTYGMGSGASRLICGGSQPHHELEAYIAKSKGTQSALTYANGYATAIGTIPAIVGANDLVILDKLCHASLIDAARLSKAILRVFPHNNTEKLEKILFNYNKKKSATSRILIIAEAVYSMDGDLCNLSDIVRLKEQYGALLLLDEAHSLGVIGPKGLGLANQENLTHKIDFHFGTLGKAAGAAGGYLAASQPWVELLINSARSFIYSTAPPPAQAAGAKKGLEILSGPDGDKLRTELWRNLKLLAKLLETPLPSSAIIPYHVGSNIKALALAKELHKQGFLIPAIRYPTVPRNEARLRITLSSAHKEKQIHALAQTLLTQNKYLRS